MRIFQVHNGYLDRGGEDVVLDRERELLESNGHEVFRYTVSNRELDTLSKKIEAVLNLSYSVKHKKRLKKILRREEPDVVHIHNLFPLLTPSVLFACSELKIPVVFTLHNFRLLCINGLFYRKQSVCEKCIKKKVVYPALINSCYRDSKIASFAPALSSSIHNLSNTWVKHVTKVIFLTPFSQELFNRSHIQFSKEQTAVKPNFTEDYGYDLQKDDFYLFAGRISEEKGIYVLMDSFKKSGKNLIIAGEGPLQSWLIKECERYDNITYLGLQSRKKIQGLFKKAKALIFTSLWYEGFGLVIIEAFSCGTPVIVSDLGNAGNLVTDGVTGLKFTPNSSASLTEKVEEFEKIESVDLRMRCRQEYEKKYLAERNYSLLIGIYESALEAKKSVSQLSLVNSESK